MLAGDLATFDALLAEMHTCDRQLAAILPDTPAAVLTSIPGVGVLTASYYGAALGDAHRFASADSTYRHSGLAPTSYESAGRRSSKVRISKVGSVELRQAIIALGTGITLHHPDFAAYKRRLVSDAKKPIVATIAVAHRAHRVAFAMIRSQKPYEPTRWAASTVKSSHTRSRSVMATNKMTRTT